MNIEFFVRVYIAIGLFVFTGALISAIYYWIRVAYYLPRLRKELSKYSNEFDIDPLDFYSFNGKLSDLSTSAQSKLQELSMERNLTINLK